MSELLRPFSDKEIMQLVAAQSAINNAIKVVERLWAKKPLLAEAKRVSNESLTAALKTIIDCKSYNDKRESDVQQRARSARKANTAISTASIITGFVSTKIEEDECKSEISKHFPKSNNTTSPSFAQDS